MAASAARLLDALSCSAAKTESALTGNRVHSKVSKRPHTRLISEGRGIYPQYTHTNFPLLPLPFLLCRNFFGAGKRVFDGSVAKNSRLLSQPAINALRRDREYCLYLIPSHFYGQKLIVDGNNWVFD